MPIPEDAPDLSFARKGPDHYGAVVLHTAHAKILADALADALVTYEGRIVHSPRSRHAEQVGRIAALRDLSVQLYYLADTRTAVTPDPRPANGLLAAAEATQAAENEYRLILDQYPVEEAE